MRVSAFLIPRLYNRARLLNIIELNKVSVTTPIIMANLILKRQIVYEVSVYKIHKIRFLS